MKKRPRGTSLTVRGKPCPCWQVINRCLRAGLDKEAIRKVCVAFEITNFSQTWTYKKVKR